MQQKKWRIARRVFRPPGKSATIKKLKEGFDMSSIFLLYEGQVLPVRYRPNARARGLKLTCSLGGDLLLTSTPDTPRQALYRFLEANRDRIGRQGCLCLAGRAPPCHP